jgi:hypothetical protein
MAEPTEEELRQMWREEFEAEERLNSRIEADELAREYESFNWDIN